MSYVIKHKKWPCQFEWHGTKQSFEEVLNILTDDLKYNGLDHFDKFESIVREDDSMMSNAVPNIIGNITTTTTSETKRKTPPRPKQKTSTQRSKQKDDKTDVVDEVQE